MTSHPRRYVDKDTGKLFKEGKVDGKSVMGDYNVTQVRIYEGEKP